MSGNWNAEQIDHEKEILKKQLETGSGRFGMFVLRTYNYIVHECRENANQNWCWADRISGRKLTAYVYNGPQDHMGREVAEDAKDKLKKMGYIRYRKEGGRWKLFIVKPIDFCELGHYVKDQPGDPDFYQRIYDHLLKRGIQIYKVPKICWRCGKSMDVITYFLGKQLEAELGPEAVPHRWQIVNSGLFDVTGLGSIDKLDRYLAGLYPTIRSEYSRQMDRTYFMNCCFDCGAHQGMNYVVYRPDELMGLSGTQLEKFAVQRVGLRDVPLNEADIRRLY